MYDPLNSSANSGPIIELDSAGTSGSSAFNLRAPDGSLLTRAQQATGALSALANDAPIAYHPDQMGSTLAYVDTADGSLEGGNVYSAFGENLESSGYGSSQSYEYLDRVSLGTTGLVNMNARSYDPELGRFLSQDPVSGNPSYPGTLNPYAYGAANPFSNPDISGLAFWDSITPPDPISMAEDAYGVASDGVSAAYNTVIMTGGDVARFTGSVASGAWNNFQESMAWVGEQAYYLAQQAEKAGSSISDFLADNKNLINGIIAVSSAAVCVAGAVGCITAAVVGFTLQSINNANHAANRGSIQSFAIDELVSIGTEALVGLSGGAGIGMRGSSVAITEGKSIAPWFAQPGINGGCYFFRYWTITLWNKT